MCKPTFPSSADVKRRKSLTRQTNLVRCSFAALLVSLIDKATQALGYGWTYTLLGALCALLLSCIYVEMRMGPKWRAAREKRESMDEQQD